GQREAADATLQFGHALLEHGAGRVHDARIDIAFGFQVEDVCAVLRTVECVGGGLVDRYRDRLGRLVRCVAAMDGDGLWAHGDSFWETRTLCRARILTARETVQAFAIP